MKNKLKISKFKEILYSQKWSFVIGWLFYFTLSNVGQTPYKIFWLFIMSGIFSLCLHLFISLVILFFKKEEI
jgi:hypothetical protein